MNSMIEDPGIPLVGRNGRKQQFHNHGSIESTDSNAGEKKRKARKFDNVGYRLAKRKELFQKRKVVCDFALVFALVGILLMVIETELSIEKVYYKYEVGSILVKTCISISTVIMLGFIVWYHWLDVKIYMIDNSLEDWRLAISTTRVIKILLELLVYAIHPIPGNYEYSYRLSSMEVAPSGTPQTPAPVISVPVDVILSLPMFLRFILVCRVMLLHSKLFTDASSQSLGALNRIHFNFRFIFKSMMTLYPEYVLTVLMITGFVVASWALRACEMYHDQAHSNFFNSMWLIAVTFLSVGYGDLVPNTYCGRGIAVMTGIFGAGCTALVVAVLARKLELSRSEKYVHNFVIDVELDKRFKIAAANILKCGWFVYKNKKLGNTRPARKYQRKLLGAIHAIREVKQEQRRLVDSSITLVEMAKSQNTLIDGLQKWADKQAAMEDRVDQVEDRLNRIEDKLDLLISKVTK